jgi:hypothetical protein
MLFLPYFMPKRKIQDPVPSDSIEPLLLMTMMKTKMVKNTLMVLP